MYSCDVKAEFHHILMISEGSHDTDDCRNGCWKFSFAIYIYIYSFSRCFYPKRLTSEEYNIRYIIKSQTVTGSACNTTFQALSRAKAS